MRTTQLAEGKTKVVFGTNNPAIDEIVSKDDITAGNGKKHDVLPGKGAWSTRTTCNIFRLLQKCGIPVAFVEQTSETSFYVKKCKMITLEVVGRREAHGSYLMRNPNLAKGHLFPKLIFELYLKTSGKKWQNNDIPCDDPMIVLSEVTKTAELFLPDKPIWEQKTFLQLSLDYFYEQVASSSELTKIEEITRKVFLILEKEWQLQGQRLVDFKLEFARTENGDIVLADVIDSDSWRKLNLAGEYSDKQVYRDGGPLAEVAAKFREAAELSDRFMLPRQQIIIWTGSTNDDTTPFTQAIEKLRHSSVEITKIVCSGHKEPVKAYDELHRAIQNIPNSVLIAAIGMSNGAGPTLSANCTIPVITVPATASTFHEDVWSSVRTPSNVPVTTVLDPRNAILAALEILSMRNSALYANLRYELEKRLVNFAIIGG